MKQHVLISIKTIPYIKKFFSVFIFFIFIQNIICFGQIYTEDFSDVNPTGWLVTNAGSGYDWSLIASTSAWNGSYHMMYTYNSSYAANTWAFTKGISMTAGYEYYVTFYQKVESSSYPEKMKVTVGTAQTVASQTTTLWDKSNLTNTGYTLQTTSSFIPSTSGTYYFAFNCYSAADMYYLYVDYVQIYETAPSYCTSASGNSATEYITNVTFSGINNTTGSTTYSDYTSGTHASVIIGAASNLSVTVQCDGTEYVYAWIDWNHDYDFADSGEAYNLGSTSTDGATLTTSITPPAGAFIGTTRMRVSEKYNAAPTYCETFNYGEVEDYSIDVASASATYIDQWVSYSLGSSTWCPGETRQVTVTVKNNGTAAWTSNSGTNVNFSYWWSNQGQDSNPRIFPFNNLAGGSQQNVTFDITAPSTPNSYDLNFDLVRENVCWFRNNSGGCGPGNSIGQVTSLTVGNAPSITGQPASATVCAGTNSCTYTVTATGTGTLSYQWERGISGSYTAITLGNIPNDGCTYSGYTSPTLTITNAPVGINAYTYRCLVTGLCTPTATSNGIASITVTNLTAPAKTSSYPQ